MRRARSTRMSTARGAWQIWSSFSRRVPVASGTVLSITRSASVTIAGSAPSRASAIRRAIVSSAEIVGPARALHDAGVGVRLLRAGIEVGRAPRASALSSTSRTARGEREQLGPRRTVAVGRDDGIGRGARERDELLLEWRPAAAGGRGVHHHVERAERREIGQAHRGVADLGAPPRRRAQDALAPPLHLGGQRRRAHDRGPTRRRRRSRRGGARGGS